MIAEKSFLDMMGFGLGNIQKTCNIDAHFFVYQIKQGAFRWIKRVVEIKNPSVDMGKRKRHARRLANDWPYRNIRW